MKDRSDRRGSPRPNRPHTGATRIRNVLLALALISAVVMLASGAWAGEPITIPVGTDHGDPGEIIPKGTLPATAVEYVTAQLWRPHDLTEIATLLSHRPDPNTPPLGAAI